MGRTGSGTGTGQPGSDPAGGGRQADTETGGGHHTAAQHLTPIGAGRAVGSVGPGPVLGHRFSFAVEVWTAAIPVRANSAVIRRSVQIFHPSIRNPDRINRATTSTTHHG